MGFRGIDEQPGIRPAGQIPMEPARFKGLDPAQGVQKPQVLGQDRRHHDPGLPASGLQVRGQGDGGAHAVPVGVFMGG